MEEVMNLLSNFGFPIAAAIALGWYIITRDKNTNEILKEFSKALNDFNITLNSMSDKFNARLEAIEDKLQSKK